MGKEIASTPAAIRFAAGNIAALSTTVPDQNCIAGMSSSDGITAGVTNDIISEIKEIAKLIDSIAEHMPEKLKKVAEAVEKADAAAAGQFK